MALFQVVMLKRETSYIGTCMLRDLENESSCAGFHGREITCSARRISDPK
jgi:hypothetical protein